MAAESTNRDSNNNLAAGYMLMAVFFYSLVPLLISQAGGFENPFLFNAAWRLGVAGGCALVLLALYRSLIMDPVVISLAARHTASWAIFWATIGNFDYALFAWATRFVDVSIAAILLETWPVFFILLTGWLLREERVYRRNFQSIFLFLVVALGGFVLVVGSQTEDFVSFDGVLFSDILFGVFLALLAAVAASLGAFPFVWGRELAGRLKEAARFHLGNDGTVFFGVILGFGISSFLVAVMNAGIGFASGGPVNLSMLTVAALGGLLLHAPASILLRKANMVTTNLGINALGYAIPVASLAWLAVFGKVDVLRVDYLVIGAVAIISTNLLINFEADIRFGFKALMLALWGCGAFVYLRDEFLIYLPFGGWLWPRETYLGALGFSATVFILLLTFRVARIAPRTQDEDNRIFALHRNLELLARRRLIAPEASEHLRAVDGSRNVEELRRAYTRVKFCFVQAAAVDLPVADRRLLANAETQLNMMVHSRQQGVDFGELFALIIFGGSTVLLSLLSRPEVSGWTAFLYEVFSALFPAVIIFLIVNVWDLHRDRANLVLDTQEGPEGYGVIFRDPRSRRFERGVSVVIGLLIIAAYAVLLWYKWIS